MEQQLPSAINDQLSDKMRKLLEERKSALRYQERKHSDWNENYELSRNKVRTNRLTQRQAVNIPLVKETEKTLLSRIDDPPNVSWKELSGDEQKQLYYQEIWDDMFRNKKFEWKDVLDKKNVLRYGLSTKMFNLDDNGVDIQIMDTFDVVYDPLTNPLDIESARFVIRLNIFRSLREILADPRYEQDGKDKLKLWLMSKEGLIQSGAAKKAFDEKLIRIKAMGLQSPDFPLFAGGDVVVNLTEHFTQIWNGKEFERHVVVYADSNMELMDEKLIDVMGADFWPFDMWMEDPETNDIYPDSIDDMIRTPNKIINVWFSQLIENRTIRNFQMHWYDATVQGYKPQTYEPGPGRMLPAPGDPNKTIMPVDISGLDETLNAIEFVTNIVERATSATAIDKGQAQQQDMTLGEIKILVSNSLERTLAMAKFYRGSWYSTAKKWDALMQANPPATLTLSKLSRNGKMYQKKVYAKEWASKAGYEPSVMSSSEQEQDKTTTIQRFQFLLTMFPNNPALRLIAQKRSLEIVDLSPDELRQVEDAEKELQLQQQQAAQLAAQNPQPQGQPQQPGQPQANPELDGIMNQVQQLQQLG